MVIQIKQNNRRVVNDSVEQINSSVQPGNSLKAQAAAIKNIGGTVTSAGELINEQQIRNDDAEAKKQLIDYNKRMSDDAMLKQEEIKSQGLNPNKYYEEFIQKTSEYGDESLSKLTNERQKEYFKAYSAQSNSVLDTDAKRYQATQSIVFNNKQTATLQMQLMETVSDGEGLVSQVLTQKESYIGLGMQKNDGNPPETKKAIAEQEFQSILLKSLQTQAYKSPTKTLNKASNYIANGLITNSEFDTIKKGAMEATKTYQIEDDSRDLFSTFGNDTASAKAQIEKSNPTNPYYKGDESYERGLDTDIYNAYLKMVEGAKAKQTSISNSKFDQGSELAYKYANSGSAADFAAANEFITDYRHSGQFEDAKKLEEIMSNNVKTLDREGVLAVRELSTKDVNGTLRMEDLKALSGRIPSKTYKEYSYKLMANDSELAAIDNINENVDKYIKQKNKIPASTVITNSDMRSLEYDVNQKVSKWQSENDGNMPSNLEMMTMVRDAEQENNYNITKDNASDIATVDDIIKNSYDGKYFSSGVNRGGNDDVSFNYAIEQARDGNDDGLVLDITRISNNNGWSNEAKKIAYDNAIMNSKSYKQKTQSEQMLVMKKQQKNFGESVRNEAVSNRALKERRPAQYAAMQREKFIKKENDYKKYNMEKENEVFFNDYLKEINKD